MDDIDVVQVGQEDARERIINRAYEIYERRIRQGALDDWLQAEREILQAAEKMRAVEFPIAKSFPPSDRLTIDILRLMAGYNDLTLIHEWILADISSNPNPSYDPEGIYTASRSSLQFRLLYSTMYEILKVLHQVKNLPGFAKTVEGIGADGRAALERLLRILEGKDPFSKTFLARTRNKTAFHYDRREFGKALARVIDRFGQETSKTYTLFRGEKTQEEDAYFPLADMVRAEISVSLVGDQGGIKELDTFVELQRAFQILLRRLLIVHSDSRGVDLGFERSLSESQSATKA